MGLFQTRGFLEVCNRENRRDIIKSPEMGLFFIQPCKSLAENKKFKHRFPDTTSSGENFGPKEKCQNIYSVCSSRRTSFSPNFGEVFVIFKKEGNLTFIFAKLEFLFFFFCKAGGGDACLV